MNIKKIAELAGVSTATVSRVINDSPRVSAKVREQVQKVIDEQRFFPNYVGRNLRQLHTKKILVTIPHASSPFYGNVLNGIEERANEQGYDVLVMVTGQAVERERRALGLLQTKQVDGAVLCAPSLDISELHELARQYPLALACIGLDGSPVPISNATIDSSRAIYDMVQHCIDQGRRRVALMRGIADTSIDIVAEQGYRNALEHNGIDYCESLNKTGTPGFTGEAMCADLMALPSPPDAIVTISDQLAIGCVRHLLRSGRIPGEDVDVVGFHDSPIASLFIPALSTLSQPMQQIGATSFDLLHEKMEDIQALEKTIILPHRLIFRETTRKQNGEKE